MREVQKTIRKNKPAFRTKRIPGAIWRIKTPEGRVRHVDSNALEPMPLKDDGYKYFVVGENGLDFNAIHAVVYNAVAAQVGGMIQVAAKKGDPFPTKAEIRAVENTQVQLYKDLVLDRVAPRFSTRAAAEKWFNEGHVPGYGDQTPYQLVAKGHAAQVIEAINAIEAGIYA